MLFITGGGIYLGLLALVLYLIAFPFLLASMITKIVHNQKPTEECIFMSMGAVVSCFLIMLTIFDI